MLCYNDDSKIYFDLLKQRIERMANDTCKHNSQTTRKRGGGPKTIAGRQSIRRGQRRRWQRVAMSEHNLQRAVFVHLNTRRQSGVFAFAVPNGGARDAKTGARLKAEGVKPGVPDIALLINGAPHFLELKTERGYLTAAQKRVREEIEAAGGQWAVAKGLDDALATLEHWGAIKPDLSMKP